MLSYVDRFAERVRESEEDLARELEEQQRRWHYQLRRGRVWFDKEVQHAHRLLRQSIPSYLRGASIPNLLTAPVIYSLIVPFALIDLWVSVYQWICFAAYGIAPVRRSAYVVLDRHKLGYLNGIEKANCMFCSYANGLIAYVREVAARTEQYWCPIRHARAIPTPHAHYRAFLDYGDAKSYRVQLKVLRSALRHDGDHLGRGRNKRACEP